MRVLVSGATGFVGRALVLRLLRDGHQPVALVRSLERARSTLGADVELVSLAQGDEPLVKAVEGADAVVNLAGAPIFGRRWNKKSKAAAWESRMGTTERLVGAIGAASSRPGVLVSASAVGIYAPFDQEFRGEEAPLGEDFLAELCQTWEEKARQAEEYGLRVVLPRIGLVLGLGGGLLSSMVPLFRRGLGGPLGPGRQQMPWIHLYDAVEALVTMLYDERYQGPVNVVGPHPVSNREFSRELAGSLGRASWLPVPRLALALVFGREAAQALLAGFRARPEALLQRGFSFRFATLRAALDDLFATEGLTIQAAQDLPDSPYLRERRPRYLLEQKTSMAVPLQEVFPFFSKASNLSVITPPEMSFDLLSSLPEVPEPGTEIDYRIALGPVPMRWKTRFEAFEPGVRFVDTQEQGPYASWWHEHAFEEIDGQTVMTDRVFYSPPFGLLGRMANALFVRDKLQEIFGFRRQAMSLRFPLQPSA